MLGQHPAQNVASKLSMAMYQLQCVQAAAVFQLPWTVLIAVYGQCSSNEKHAGEDEFVS